MFVGTCVMGYKEVELLVKGKQNVKGRKVGEVEKDLEGLGICNCWINAANTRELT